MAKPKKSLILVVDDEVKIRDILNDILTHANYLVALAKDGEEALALVKTKPVDLVLLDLVMPGIDGMVVLEELRTLNPLLPILIVSAHGNVAKAVEAVNLGAVDFIEKPIKMENLLDKIAQYLKQGEQIRISKDKTDEIFN